MTRRQMQVDQTGDLTEGQYTSKVILLGADGEPLDLGGGTAVTWSTLTGKPTTFPPTTGTTATTAMPGNTALLAIGTTAGTAADAAATATALAGKAATSHTQAGTTVTVAASAGIVGANVQAVLADLAARVVALETAV